MLKKEQMLFTDFPKMGKITYDVREKNKNRIFTGGIRIGKGMYRTDDEAERYKLDSLRRKLP